MALPDAIENAPELGPGLEFFYVAFLDLTSCRDVGYATGPVTWLTIQRYSEVYGVEGEQREDLFHHIQKMDEAYLKWQRAQAKAKTPPPETPKRPHRRGTRG